MTWMCLTIRLPVSRPLASALDSAFLRRPSRYSADLVGHRALERPNCLPVEGNPVSVLIFAKLILHESLSHLRSSPDTQESLLLMQIPCQNERFQISGRSHRTLSAATGAASVAAHGDGLLLLLDVLEELHGALELPAVDGLGGLAGVLEGHTQVGTAGAGRLLRCNLGGGVASLSWGEEKVSLRGFHVDVDLRRLSRGRRGQVRGAKIDWTFVVGQIDIVLAPNHRESVVGGATHHLCWS